MYSNRAKYAGRSTGSYLVPAVSGLKSGCSEMRFAKRARKASLNRAPPSVWTGRPFDAKPNGCREDNSAPDCQGRCFVYRGFDNLSAPFTHPKSQVICRTGLRLGGFIEGGAGVAHPDSLIWFVRWQVSLLTLGMFPRGKGRLLRRHGCFDNQRRKTTSQGKCQPSRLSRAARQV